MAELESAAISDRLQAARTRAGLTQQEMADLLQVHKRTVEDWESPRKKNVPYERMGEWADLTHVTVAWLLHGDEETATPEQIQNLEARLERVEGLALRILELLQADRG